MKNLPPSNAADYAAVAARLCELKPMGSKFGIDRMRVLAEALGHPEALTPCVHVAGTNGKGSVSAMLDAILRRAGWKTGLFTSPHLVHLGERIQVNRRPLTEMEIIAYVQELGPVSTRIEAESAEMRPSFFELLTAMAFLQFAREKCDIAVFEVGLGGRLDATNVVAPEVCVITSIGLDHCEYLGSEITQIASEKAGIIKPGVPVILGRMPAEAETVIRTIAGQRRAPVVSVSERFGEKLDSLPRTNLEGNYQRWNAATATLVAQALPERWNVTPGIVERGLADVFWAGRWQRVQVGGRGVILDASHNPEGAQVLGENLGRLVAETGRKPIVITGVLGTARAQPLIETLCRYSDEIHFVVPAQPRACDYETLESLVPRGFTGTTVRDSVKSLFPAPDRCTVGGQDDVVVVTGSIYLIGEVMARLGGIAARTGTS